MRQTKALVPLKSAFNVSVLSHISGICSINLAVLKFFRRVINRSKAVISITMFVMILNPIFRRFMGYAYIKPVKAFTGDDVAIGKHRINEIQDNKKAATTECNCLKMGWAQLGLNQ
jgi:hypothetical protein